MSCRSPRRAVGGSRASRRSRAPRRGRRPRRPRGACRSRWAGWARSRSRRGDVLEELEAPVAVWRLEHGDLGVVAVEADGCVGPLPLTSSRPSTVSPRSVKNAIVASRSRTAIPTFSSLMGMRCTLSSWPDPLRSAGRRVWLCGVEPGGMQRLSTEWFLHAADVPYVSRARSGAVLGQGRDWQPVGSEELGEVDETGGVAAHSVGGRGDPLHHHLADLLLNGALGIRDVPR